MLAEEPDRRFARPAAPESAVRGDVIEPVARQPGMQPVGDRIGIGQHQLGRGGQDRLGQAFDDPGELDLAIGLKGKAGALGRGLLGPGPPAGQPLHAGAFEEQRAAEQLFDRLLDLGPH